MIRVLILFVLLIGQAQADPLQPDTEYTCKLTCSEKTVEPPVEPPIEPPTDWVAALPAGQWARVETSNALADIDPANSPRTNANHPNAPSYRGVEGFSGIWDDWTGGAYAPDGSCGSLLFWGGGHAGYWGNEVVALNLCGEPRWERLSDPYQPVPWAKQSSSNYTEFRDGFPDGSPPAAHTYDGVEYLSSVNAFAILTHDMKPTPVSVPAVWLFDLDARRWSGPVHYSGLKPQHSAYDSKRGLFWFQPQHGLSTSKFSVFDPSKKAVTQYETANTSPYTAGLDSIMAYNPADDLLVVTNFREAKTLAERPPGATGWASVKETNRPLVSGGHVMEWSDARQALIVWFPGRVDVWELKRSNGVYAWTSITDSASLNPALSGNQVYSKYRIATIGGQEILIGMSRPKDGIYAFKIPSSKPVADLCALPGVFHCETFDDADIAPAKLYTGNAMPFVEDGKLVMLIPELSGSNPGGDYRITFPPINKTLAFSFKIKADAGAVETQGRKQFILWGGQSSCTNLELAQTHNGASVIVPYAECGAGTTYLTIPGTSDYQLHYPDYDCKYQAMKAGNLTGCVVSVANEWDHYYIETEMGEPGTPTSRLTMWHRKDGEWKRYIHRDDWTFRASSQSENGWNNFMLTPYVTRKDPTVPGPAGRVEYDDLIMSTQPFRDHL